MNLFYTDNNMNKIRIIQKLIDKKISIYDASKAINCSIRTIYRYKSTLINQGPPGFIHGLTGKTPNHNPNSSKHQDLDKIISMKKFIGFGPTLLSEKLFEIYGFHINKESLRKRMIRLGLWLPKPKKKIVKKHKRKRADSFGLMIQIDGSYHDRFENGSEYCLINAIDDSTSNINLAKFTQGESLNDLYEFIKEYININGKPQSIYLDCHSTYKVNYPKDQFDREMTTRLQKACNLLGIEIIYSKCPEGKGRVENSFKTHQDRLIKEMRLAGIDNIYDANNFLKDYYIPKHNYKFYVSPNIKGDFHIPISEYEYNNLEWFFAKQDTRTIKRDGTISYNNTKYQIHKKQLLPAGKQVNVITSMLGKVKILSGEKELVFDIIG